MPTDPDDQTNPSAVPESPPPEPAAPKASKASARKSAKPSAKRSSPKAKKPAKKSAKKAGKAKAKRKASPKVGSKKRSSKRSGVSSSRSSTKSTKKGRQGIRLDGKPRAAKGERPPLSKDDLKYGAKIALARRLKPMSQGGAVKKLGLSQGFYSAVERGTVHANDALRAKIKKVVGV
jgi:hypothetical protein